MSCCRRSAFSATSSARRVRSTASPKTNRRRSITYRVLHRRRADGICSQDGHAAESLAPEDAASSIRERITARCHRPRPPAGDRVFLEDQERGSLGERFLLSRQLPLELMEPVVGQNSIVTLDDGMARSDARAQWPSYSLSWAPPVLRSGAIPISRWRTWRSASNSPCSATTRSGRGSGASIAPSGYGSPSGGAGGARRSTSFAPRQ